MKKNPLQDLTDEEIARKRKSNLLWGMIPATIFTLLEIYITYNPEFKAMEVYVFMGFMASLYFIFQAAKYSKEWRRRKG